MRTYSCASPDDEILHPVGHGVAAIGVAADPEEFFGRKIVPSRTHVGERAASGEPGHRGRRFEHPVSAEGSGPEDVQIDVPAKHTWTAVAGANRKASPRCDRAKDGVEAHGWAQDPLEDPVVLKPDECTFHPRGFGRRELLGLGLTLEPKRRWRARRDEPS